MTRSRRFVALALAVVLAGATVAQAKELAGVTMPDTLSVGGKTLKLNGLGLRKKAIVKVYVGGLYLETPSKDAAADGKVNLEVFHREEWLRAFGDGLRVGGVMGFFPGMADPGEFGFGVQQPAAAFGFEMAEAGGIHLFFDDAESGGGGGISGRG